MSVSLQEEAMPYPPHQEAESIASRLAAMSQQERWAFYETEGFAAELTGHFHRAKVKALTSGPEFYQSR